MASHCTSEYVRTIVPLHASRVHRAPRKGMDCERQYSYPQHCCLRTHRNSATMLGSHLPSCYASNSYNSVSSSCDIKTTQTAFPTAKDMQVRLLHLTIWDVRELPTFLILQRSFFIRKAHKSEGNAIHHWCPYCLTSILHAIVSHSVDQF